jgi:autotransporter-associated beta strand protein
MSGSGNTTLNLYGTQSYTGTTSVTSGEIITTVAMASTAYAISGGRFSTGTNSLITNNASVTLSGTGIFALGGNETLGSIAGTGGTLAINGFQLTTDSNADATFAGAITGASSRIVKKGTGTLSLTGSSNAGGGLFIDNGVVDLNGATIGFSGIDIGAGLAGDQSANNATLRVTSASTYSQNIVVNSEGTTTGTRTIDFANSSGTATLSGSVNLEKAAIVSVATNGTGVLSGQLSGVGGVTKTGAGILTLSGNNSAYSATATVSAGTLLLNHSFGGAVSVASNANLGGSMSSGQSVSGLVTLNSNSGLAPGNGSAGNIATMNFSNGLTLNSSSTVTMDLTTSASSADRINVSGGQLTYAGNLVFNAVSSMSGVTNNTYTLFNTTGATTTGSWASVALASGGPNFTNNSGIWTRNAGDGNIWTYDQSQGTLTVIPEPSTYALMGVGAAFLLWRIRRRKRD